MGYESATTGSTNRKVLLVAIIVALAGAGLLMLYKERFELEARGGEPTPVLMATKDIPAGQLVEQAMIGIREIPEKYVEGRHIRAKDAQRIIGVRAQTTVKANESLLWSDVATGAERRQLSSLIKNGMRAVTIKVNSSALAGMLRPGNRVDVLLTTDPPGRNKEKKISVPLLQNLLILAVGTDLGAAHQISKRRTARNKTDVTLSVTMAQAQILSLAVDQGELAIVLRNDEDISVVDSPEINAGEILGDQRKTGTTRLNQGEDDAR